MRQFMKIGDICEVLNGYAFKSAKYVKEGVRVIRITNVQKGVIEDSEPQYYPISDCAGLERYMLFEGDLLISLTGNVGRVAILGKEMLPAALNQRVACLRIKCPSEIYKPFLFHLLNSDFFEAQCIFASKGIAQKNMSTEWLKEYRIPVFEMDKQREIANIFDSIDALIAKRKGQLSNLNKLVKSRFIEMFRCSDYPKAKLGDVCSKITDGTHKTPKYQSSGITFISAKNIIRNEIDFSDVKYISEAEYQEIQNRCQTEINDIVLSKSGTLGVPAIVRTEQQLGLFESLAVLKYDRLKLLPEFLCEQIKSDEVQRQFASGTKGVAVKHLHLGVIADTVIILPPIELQEQFTGFVQSTDKSKLAVQKSLDELEILKKSLMQKYFN